MNTADEKGSAISVGIPGKFLPQPGPLSMADLSQYTGLFRKFFDDSAGVETPATPTATFAPRPILRPVVT